jgi:histidine triad (HIT) family protein
MSDTIFARIVRGEIPAQIVAETANALAFRDIAPQAPVHILVIPKLSVATLDDVDDAALLGELLALARDVARQEGLVEAGYRVVINTRDDGGQTVPHLHLHVLGGRALTWPPG